MKKITKTASVLIATMLLMSAVAIVLPVKAIPGPLYTVTTQAEADDLPLDIDATGYDIGVLVTGDDIIIEGITVHDATKYGIRVEESIDVVVKDCSVYKIGTHTGSDFTPNGAQYGAGIYYYMSSGKIDGNTVSEYQKGGIVVNLPSSVGKV